MEKLVKVAKEFALNERPYTDRNNIAQMFISKGLLLTDGVDTFYAEATGEYARTIGNFSQNVFYRVQLQMAVRTFKDKDDNNRYSNEIRIIKIG